MSETEKNQPPSATDKIRRPVNQQIAVFAVIVSLLAAVLALSLWFNVKKLRQQNQAFETQLHGAMEALQKSEHEQRAALTVEGRERDQALAGRQESIEQEVQAIREQLGRDHGEWLAAESDYTLRLANRRLTMERDVRGALIALRAADGMLAEGANPLYLPVREQLRSEIQSLEAVTPVDVDGIALELSAMSKQLDTLPLATARRDVTNTQMKSAQAADEKGSVVGRFFGAMWSSLKGMVTVRRLDQKALPLLPPEQHYFLTQNLRLRLEMARLALLRGDAAVYQESMKTASAWLNDYFDHGDDVVKHNRDELARLAQINIAPALPEIGNSLRTLERIREKQSGRKPAGVTRSRQP